MRWIFLEFANLNLQDKYSFQEWVSDSKLFYGQEIGYWLWTYTKNLVIEEARNNLNEPISEDYVFELNGINSRLEEEKELRIQWLYENKDYFSNIQEELRMFLKDIAEGNNFMKEINEKYSNDNNYNMIGLKLEKQLNEKLNMIRFGISLEVTNDAVKRVIKPIINNFEVMLYADLIKYINDGYDVILCSRCTGIIEDPKTGQLRNSRRGINVYCDDCREIHLREKNKIIKQRSRRKRNAKAMEK